MPTHHTDEELRQGADRAEHALKALRTLRAELKAGRASGEIGTGRADYLIRLLGRATGKIEKVKTGYTAEMAFRERLTKWTDATAAEFDFAAPIINAILRDVEPSLVEASSVEAELAAIRVAATPYIANLIKAAGYRSAEESARENSVDLTVTAVFAAEESARENSVEAPTVIYCVRGEVGEYDAHDTWPVKAFRDLDEAKAFAAAATAHAAAWLEDTDFFERVSYADPLEGLTDADFERLTAYDPNLATTDTDGVRRPTGQHQYGGRETVSYYVEEITLDA